MYRRIEKALRGETSQKQTERISQFKTQGDRQLAEEGRIEEITIDMVLRAQARMAEEQVSGPEDSVVTAIVKEFPQEKILEITKKNCQKRFKGREVLGEL